MDVSICIESEGIFSALGRFVLEDAEVAVLGSLCINRTYFISLRIEEGNLARLGILAEIHLDVTLAAHLNLELVGSFEAPAVCGIMPFAVAFYRDGLVVVDVETFLLEVVVVACCSVFGLYICNECIELCICCDDRGGGELLAVFLQFASPTAEFLAFGYGYLLFHAFCKFFDVCILLNLLGSENRCAVYIIIGEGEVWLEGYGEFVSYLISVKFYNDVYHGLLVCTFAGGSICCTLDGSVFCNEVFQRIGLADEVCLL